MSEEKTPAPKRPIAKAAAKDEAGYEVRPVVALYLVKETRFGRGTLSHAVQSAGGTTIEFHDKPGFPHYLVKTTTGLNRVPVSAVVNEVIEGSVR